MGLRISLLGRGAWGSTLEQLWSEGGHGLRGWSRRQGGDPSELLTDCDLVVSALAMEGLRPVASRLAPHWPPGLPLLSCSKGIDLEALCTASGLWRSHLSETPIAVLSGPNLADELRRGLPAASVIASGDGDLAKRLQGALRTPNLRLYRNDDPIGTEAAAALKNVMALAAGVSDGLGLGANARASLLCRGLAEIGVVLRALGGQPSTLYGLAGLGDLLATATSPLSRNYRCGLLLAEGLDEAAALRRIGATVEGTRTARATLQLALRHGWTVPICTQVVQLLEGVSDARTAVRCLMERDPRAEAEP
ncbi:MAG: NAD(P)H-dependent glycerol-3-phosphate dehydrogenase [Synechococcaceae cyanobacterium]|jgi:glycerol-3-phosphate dehydrogenase (NAD(P)+)